MKVTGIIAEYNPFHNGHSYHLERARELSGADYIIAVMSGNYVQRGAPALLDKYLRCEMALSQGADLVLELPTLYATASAEAFAAGAVALLDLLGVADTLCFGSESGDIRKLEQLAVLMAEEEPEFQTALQRELRSGRSYPAARQRALELCGQTGGETAALLTEPNNILGLEYLKALRRRKSAIRPCTIPRLKAGYHELAPSDGFASASALRSLYARQELSSLSGLVPQPVYRLLCREYGRRFPIFPNDLSTCLYYRLLMEKNADAPLWQYQDTSPEIGARILRELPSFQSFEEFAARIKTRQYTLTRINRSLLHILLGIRTTDYKETPDCHIPYARVLGFRPSSSALLKAIKKNTSIPLITKLADADALLDACGRHMLSQDIFASDLYRRIQEEKYHQTLPNEYTQTIIKF